MWHHTSTHTALQGSCAIGIHTSAEHTEKKMNSSLMQGETTTYKSCLNLQTFSCDTASAHSVQPSLLILPLL